MADEGQEEILRKGADVWNLWRKEHPDVKPNLVGVNLQDALLDRVDFRDTIISGAQLGGAHLHSVNLQRATLIGADLRKAKLSHADFSESGVVS